MVHLVAHARPGTSLFHDWHAGVRCLEAFASVFVGFVAICVMPGHVHVQGAWQDLAERMRRAESAYSRWRIQNRGATSGSFVPAAPPTRISDKVHARRTARYIYLNPCREGLAACPLEWPLSTYRDRVGLSIRPLIDMIPQPERHHAYVSGDPDAAVAGTPFPAWAPRRVELEQVADAASALARVPLGALVRTGPSRSVALQASWVAGFREVDLLAARFQLSERRVRGVVRALPSDVDRIDPAVLACLAAAGDPRFPALDHGDLRRLPAWPRGLRAP